VIKQPTHQLAGSEQPGNGVPVGALDGEPALSPGWNAGC
jgi:hypothetical protein